MRDGARLQTSIELLDQIDLLSGKPADAVLADGFRQRRYAGSKDKQAISGIVYGVLRRRAEIDWHLHALGGTISNRMRAFGHLMLASGADVDRVTRLCGDNDYAPAVLSEEEYLCLQNFDGQVRRTDGGEGDMPPAAAANMPEWAVAGLQDRFGDAWIHVAAALSVEAPVDVRVNRLKGTREAAQLALRHEDIHATECAFSPDGLRLKYRRPLSGTDAFKSGLIEVQDEGSQLASLLVDAKPGHKVVDFCAGAGGKTLAMAAGMGNAGRIIACDTSEARLKRAGDRLKRAGSFIVERRTLSSARDKWVKRRSGRFDGGFDRVLVDAPCSGTGTWRRNPDQKWKQSEAGLGELIALQDEILDSASRLVAPGGRLVYVTCSLMPQENEARVQHFLNARSDFFLFPIGDVWRDVFATDPPGDDDMLCLNPKDHGTDGFFIAVMGRRL